MSLGTATYTTETTEDIDTFSGFIKIDISDFNEVQKDATVTLKGNDKSNIFKIADFTKATLDGKGGTDVIEINVGKDLTIDLRDQSGTEGSFKNIEGIAISNYQPSNVTLKGDDDDNIFKSGDGNDTVYGYGGNDFIYVDSGADIHYGGEGKDTAIFASAYRHHTIEIDSDDEEALLAMLAESDARKAKAIEDAKIKEIDLDENEKKEFMKSIEAVKKLWEAASVIDPNLIK